MTRHMLVPFDGSPVAEAVLPYASVYARLTGAALTLLRVVELPPVSRAPLLAPLPSGPDNARESSQRNALKGAEAYLNQAARDARRAGLTVHTRVMTGHPADVIVAEAGAFDLVAMATHGRGGLGRWVSGSVATRVMQTTPTPLLLVRAAESAPEAVEPPRRILVPLDGSALAEQALPLATSLARLAGAEIILLQSVEWATLPFIPPYIAGKTIATETIEGARREAERYLRQIGETSAGPDITTRVDIQVEPAADAILSRASEWKVDLIVMSTHGRGGLGRWSLGSVADRVAREASAPVLLTRAKPEAGTDPLATSSPTTNR